MHDEVICAPAAFSHPNDGSINNLACSGLRTLRGDPEDPPLYC